MDAMSKTNRIWFSLCLGGLCVWLNGCTPTASGQAGDQHEPNFMLGENRLNASDYPGAIRAFGKVLEVNPQSAAAHFELGWLYDQKVPRPAIAIYHYERYLKLEPDAANVAVVKQRIEVCKQALAKNVLGLPCAPAEQQQIEQLIFQNQQLRADLDRWHDRCAGLIAARQTSSMATMWRTCTVGAGETAFRIARHYGVSLAALLAANPGVEPRRMAVGLVLKIPSRRPL
jgi:tetratricopeptide (TPR) repeat protein